LFIAAPGPLWIRAMASFFTCSMSCP
jgi:hypothetical protein